MFANSEKTATPSNKAASSSADGHIMADGIVKDMRNGLESTAHDLRQAANNAGTAVRDIAEKAATETSRATHDAMSYVRTNPLQSSMIALGAGMVIGALLRR